MKKRLLAILLALAMMVSLLTFPVSAETYRGTCGDNLTWELTEYGTLTISGTGDMEDYDYYSEFPWYSYADEITTVVINDGVTSISDYAFSLCRSVTSIEIPSSITSIGYEAFSYCQSLASIEIPSSVTNIGSFAFYECTSLTSINIPDSVTSIGSYAFAYCTSLTSVTLPSECEYGSYVFRGCSGLIDNDGFLIIDGILFDYTGNNDTITIPAEVKEINSGLLQSSSASAFALESGNTAFSVADGVLFSSDMSVLVAYPGGRTDSTYEIPETVVTIGDYAFYDNDYLTSITIPGNVVTIGEAAFAWCTWITSVVIEEGVQIIGDSAFEFIGDYWEHTSALTEIVIPEGVTYIGDFAFYHIYQLESITLPESLTYIGEAAFTTDACFDLAYDELVIPANVSYIGPIAFMGANLTSITFEGDAPEILVPEVYVSAIVSNPSILGGVKATVYYYSDAEGWTDEFKASLNTSSGELTFVELTREAQSESTTEEGSTGDTEDVSLAFSDVSSSEYYYDAVLWAVENGVTTGTSASIFSPNSACTRAQVVTFLYRAAGEPSVSGIENPFTDVSSGDYYYNAVLWAVENGITTGTTASTFSPDNTCTRGQVVTFLYRYAGTDISGADNPFTDVSVNEYYYDAVLWAVENGVTTGTTTSTFSPENSCTRAHVVTFLYRALSE